MTLRKPSGCSSRHTRGPRTTARATRSGSALALALDAGGRPADALALCEELSALRGGSYLDRLYCRLAAGFAFVQQGAASDAAAAFEEAQTAAFATDSRLDRAIVIVARSYAYAALDLPSGHELGYRGEPHAPRRRLRRPRLAHRLRARIPAGSPTDPFLSPRPDAPLFGHLAPSLLWGSPMMPPSPPPTQKWWSSTRKKTRRIFCVLRCDRRPRRRRAGRSFPTCTGATIARHSTPSVVWPSRPISPSGRWVSTCSPRSASPPTGPSSGHSRRRHRRVYR